MRAERQAKELSAKGEAISEEMAQTLYDLGSDLAPNGTIWAKLAGASAGGGTASGGGVPLTGTNDDGSMRFPPGVGDGPKGDPNSAEKVRARRMRAERQFKELSAAGDAIPEEMAKTLFDTGSDLAPGGTIWATLAGAGGGSASTAPASATGGVDASGKMIFPAGIGDGPKGDPNCYEKVRARRMRAERNANEAIESGNLIPENILATLRELGSPLAGV